MTGPVVTPRDGTGPQPLSMEFGLDDLAEVRHAVARRAREYGLWGHPLDGFVVAVNEIVANAATHGGPRGALRLWHDGQCLRCRVSDHGPGLAPEKIVDTPPPISVAGGRGLWLARQLCDIDIGTGPQGTTIEVSVLPSAGDREPGHPA